MKTQLKLIKPIKAQYDVLFYLGNKQEGYEVMVDKDHFMSNSLEELKQQIEFAGYSDFKLELLED